MQQQSYAHLEVPCTTCYYREVRAGADRPFPCYQLEAAVHATHTFYYSNGTIARNTLADGDLRQIQLFDELLLAECNALTLRLVLITERDGAYLCAPVAHVGHLRVLSHAADPPPYDLARTARIPASERDWTTTHGVPVYAWFHQYAETNTPGYYTHQGLTLLHSKTVGLPLFMTSRSLNGWIKRWMGETRMTQLFTFLHISRLNGTHALRRVIPLTAWSEEARKMYPAQTDHNAHGLRASFELKIEYGHTEDEARPVHADFS